MTTEKYIQELEAEVKRMELRELMANDSRKKAEIKKNKDSKIKVIKKLRMAFDRKFVTSEGKTMEYETATVNLN